MEKRFYFFENWNGKKQSFDTLPQARKAAKNETGISVTIYDSRKKFPESNIVEFAPASNYCPA